MRSEYDFSKGITGKHVGKKMHVVGDLSVQKGAGRTRKSPVELKTTSVELSGRILSTKHVSVSWVYENTEGYVYENVSGSIVPNVGTGSLRFELKERNGDDQNFEVIIRRSNGSYVLFADHPEIKNQEFPLTVFLGSDELVLYLEDLTNRAYFHLSES